MTKAQTEQQPPRWPAGLVSDVSIYLVHQQQTSVAWRRHGSRVSQVLRNGDECLRLSETLPPPPRVLFHPLTVLIYMPA